MTIKDIESAVTHLAPRDLAEFRAWFQSFDARAWDQQIERDAKTGKLDRLADEALNDFQNNRCKDL